MIKPGDKVKSIRKFDKHYGKIGKVVRRYTTGTKHPKVAIDVRFKDGIMEWYRLGWIRGVR